MQYKQQLYTVQRVAVCNKKSSCIQYKEQLYAIKKEQLYTVQRVAVCNKNSSCMQYKQQLYTVQRVAICNKKSSCIQYNTSCTQYKLLERSRYKKHLTELLNPIQAEKPQNSPGFQGRSVQDGVEEVDIYIRGDDPLFLQEKDNNTTH